MIIINDNDSSNPYDESDDNKTKIKNRITKVIKVLLTWVAIKTNSRNYKMLMITTMIIIIRRRINNTKL